MRAKLLILFFGLPLLFACLSGCGGPPSAQGEGGQSPSAPGPGGVPELTDEMIRERINFAFIRKIPEENGDGEPMSWTFMPDEPKDISIVEKKIEGNHATVVLDVKTGSGPRANGPRSLAGQIRTEWELRTGWVLRQWDIVDTENISMKYKKLPKLPLPDNSNTGQHGDDSDLPKPPAQNSNH
ncbi:MAG TPA: hypothetical protein VMZ26_07985 [Pyrinomonadaceae bacterium]|nr:hypothetical protein [Pyrinomonadaceae bacterium]